MSINLHQRTSSDINGASRHSYKLDDMLTLKQVAEKLNTPIRTVRDWRAKGILPVTRLHPKCRKLYVHAGVVEDMLRRNATSAAPPRQTLTEQGGAQTGEPKK